MAVWTSWPQACITPGCCDRYGAVFSSWIGKRIEVSAEADDTIALPDLDDETGSCGANHRLQTHREESFGHLAGGAMLAPTHLGVRVDIAPQFDHRGSDGASKLDNGRWVVAHDDLHCNETDPHRYGATGLSVR